LDYFKMSTLSDAIAARQKAAAKKKTTKKEETK